MTPLLVQDKAFWYDETYWGLADKVRLSVNKHGVYRYHTRIKPNLPLGHCAAELQARVNNEPLTFRLNKKDRYKPKITWLMLVGVEDPFTIVAKQEIRQQVYNHNLVMFVWRMITVLKGHDHW